MRASSRRFASVAGSRASTAAALASSRAVPASAAACAAACAPPALTLSSLLASGLRAAAARPRSAALTAAGLGLATHAFGGSFSSLALTRRAAEGGGGKEGLYYGPPAPSASAVARVGGCVRVGSSALARLGALLAACVRNPGLFARLAAARIRHECGLALRLAYLSLVFAPLFLVALACASAPQGSRRREFLLRSATAAIERAGPAFIKWAQWASTRRDMFPADLCAHLERLQSGTSGHSFAETRRAVEASLGLPLEAVFADFDEVPVASGSIAQVHEARLTELGSKLALRRDQQDIDDDEDYQTWVHEQGTKSAEEDDDDDEGRAHGTGSGTGSVEPSGASKGRQRAAVALASSSDASASDPPSAPAPSSAPSSATLPRLPPRRASLDASTARSPPSRRSRALDARAFAPGAKVAVKVRHPDAEGTMERDVELLRRVAAGLSAVPLTRPVGETLAESLRQFGAPLREQLDLRVEAAHLDRFCRNFSAWRGVRFPRAAGPALVGPAVLVESFECGKPIGGYLKTPGTPEAVRIARLGLDCYLKMLLRDRFVHADLHPGNILVDERRIEPPGVWESLASLDLSALLDRALAGSEHARAPSLVLLDVGMAASIGQKDGKHLVSFFAALAEMDGAAVADAVLSFAAPEPPAEARASFRASLRTLFGRYDADSLRANTQDVVNELMESIRRHDVRIGGVVSTVIVTSCVLEGWSSALNPEVRVLDRVRSILPQAFPSRIAARLDAAFTPKGQAQAVW